MRRKLISRGPNERGQTIILVAVSVVSLFAMAALAVDVITLYVAKNQVQHAADACALAGAKAFVESAVTTDSPLDPQYITLQGIAQNVAAGYIAGALLQNPVSGSPATLFSTPTFDFTYPGNPRITLTVQRSNLPIFFARIWSRDLASVSATASAEAYNPSNSQTGSPIPVAPQCIKPMMVRNSGRGPTGPKVPTPFINTTDGNVNPSYPGTANSGGFIGLEFTLRSTFVPCGGTKTCVRYIQAAAPTTHNFCSSCAAGVDYEQSLECCDGSAYNFTQCGNSLEAQALSDNTTDPSALTEAGVECLIHASGPGPGNGQDSLHITDFLTNNDPIQIFAGTHSQTSLNVAANAPISTSDSVMTLPIYDDTAVTGNQVTIVGFLQVFVNSTAANGDLDLTILNVVGCGSVPPIGTSSVSGGGISPIPVRLITPP